MIIATECSRPRYGWYGDDFTGATDTLATWAERGYRALLFLREPTPRQLAAAGPLDAIGIAGATRSMPPAAATPHLDAAGRFFAGQQLELLHYKCCSTFDSAAHVGSIGAAVKTLAPYFPNAFVPIVGGQPNLGRYCLFGTLFAAAGTGGDVYRIDRHPTMSVHPVTPMGEADLRKHLAAQGLARLALVDYRAYATSQANALLDACLASRPDAVLLDVADAEDLPIIGRLIAGRLRAGPMLAVGPSSVAHALAALSLHERHLAPTATPARHEGPTLALVGSLSPITRAQVDAASDYARVEVDPARLLNDAAYADATCRQSLRLLSGRNVMLLTEPARHQPKQAEHLALATGKLLRAILSDATVSRIIVAGGDTSSHAIAALDVWGLSYRAPMVPGAPLCRIHSDEPRLDGLDIVLKGGQIGPPNFFGL
ncbi:four-carbon acid sugar kinase family protein [Bradyrhizobium sp. LHD-71]|uniref:four-carbon acid sugar kinase family protein n=1 Tax=Bradyrhizobium sp. LHD-71 TaxID=3072141 RepID=UPI00280F676D|nr:four-carbon acid sugar kinase family protein [Bradyrhizobium sp. LHD-71]MDQ8726867.1 four-carbon acid sugar kinase family protein [Bradyrhizobium sp. LHD-71]